MRINKGKVRPGTFDARTGNFVFHDETDHIKFQDINGGLSVRVSKKFPSGFILQQAFDGAKKKDGDKQNFLHNYSAIFYNLLSAVPDAQFFEDLIKAAHECVNRHKDLYGLKEDATKEEDDAILKEEVELAEAEAEARKEEGLE